MILSLPINGVSVKFQFSLSKYVNLHYTGKAPFIKTKVFKEHYWEINNPVSLSSLEKNIKNKYDILKQYRCKENPYHYFFVLEVL